MLAIDTNLVVRYLVGDHPAQSTKARRLIDNNDVYICTTVLLESEWVLRSVYDFELARVATALASFSGLPRVTVENSPMAATALNWMSKGMDFADALHLLQSKDCEAFVTFDARLVKAASRIEGQRVHAP
jgi:predicted nucleic-acid-binding protein